MKAVLAFLKSLLFKTSGKISKEKITAMIAAALALLQTLGVIDLSNDEMTAIATALAAFWAIFARTSREEETAKVVDAVQTSAVSLGGQVASADASAQKAAKEAKKAATAVTDSIALVAAKQDRDSPQ
jgi:hypothetical protein